MSDKLQLDLLYAAKEGCLDGIHRCLDAGADPAYSNNAALVLAVVGGHLEIVKALVAAGAPLEKAEDDESSHAYISYVTLAYDSRQWDIAEYLIQQGAEPHLRIGIVSGQIMKDAPLEKLKVFARNSIDIERMQDKGEQGDSVTFLTMAMVAGRSEALDWFLGQGHLNDETKRVIFQRTLIRRPAFLALLKNHGIFYHDDRDQGTPLLRAINGNSPEAVRALIALGADVNQRAPYPALLKAVNAGSHAVVEALLEGNADIFMFGGEVFVRAAGRDKAFYEMVQEQAARQQAGWLEKYNSKFSTMTARDILAATDLPYGQSGVLMAIKAGVFPELLEKIRAEKACFDEADPLLLVQQDDHGTSAVRLLMFTGKLDLLVDPALWKDLEKGLNSLLPFLPESWARPDFQKKVTEALLRHAADKDIGALHRKLGNKNRFRL